MVLLLRTVRGGMRFLGARNGMNLLRVREGTDHPENMAGLLEESGRGFFVRWECCLGLPFRLE